ncbi:hypothetical protein [Nostoc sp. FACHB-280]|uniref:hypothetical protein n=1 Tax=Nostoc sp. FACHB-280 TaxID=2692839 RepID=UPI00168ACF88|nr:hypothetical protein [Nostoc sp. FACHB-280]MBD2496825.1 hypothetical protein [Nostoc sp. FACHB-280]
MDIVQSQQIIEQSLNALLTQSPDSLEKVKQILGMIVHGVQVFGSISVLSFKSSELVVLANQLLNLLLTGGSIHEIAIALLNFATSLGLSIEVITQLLQIIVQILAFF